VKATKTEPATEAEIVQAIIAEVRGLRSNLEEAGYLTPSQPSEFERARDRAEQKRQLRVLDGGKAS
jgi:hypothetical protein